MGKERKEEKEKGRRTDCSPSIFRCSADQGVGIVHAPRGRGFSYSGYFMLKGHSMAIGFGPNYCLYITIFSEVQAEQARLFFLQFGLTECWPHKVV